MFALEAIASAFQKAHSPWSATDMKARSLELLIGIKEAKLYVLGDLLKPQPVAWSKYALMRPDEWVQRLAEVKLLHDYAGRLSESFEAVTKDAHVPRRRSV